MNVPTAQSDWLYWEAIKSKMWPQWEELRSLAEERHTFRGLKDPTLPSSFLLEHSMRFYSATNSNQNVLSWPHCSLSMSVFSGQGPGLQGGDRGGWEASTQNSSNMRTAGVGFLPTPNLKIAPLTINPSKNLLPWELSGFTPSLNLQDSPRLPPYSPWVYRWSAFHTNLSLETLPISPGA